MSKGSVWYRKTSGGLYVIVGWGWAVAAALFASFYLWSWFAIDVMNWPFVSVLVGLVVLVLTATALFAMHADG